MKETRTYPLRLPRALKEAVERISREDRTSYQPIRGHGSGGEGLRPADGGLFQGSAGTADVKAFDKIMEREAEASHGRAMKCRHSPTALLDCESASRADFRTPPLRRSQ
jgi:hypothetical protein